MSEIIWVAMLTVGGNIIVSGLGIAANRRMINYRIEQLEKKVDKHNGIYDDVYKLKETCAVMDEKMAVANHRIEDLEQKKARKSE